MQLSHKPFFALVALLALAPLGARAGELAILRNGFEQRCDHHGVVEGKLRLFLHADGESFLEYAPEQVERFEPVPDDPPPPALAPQEQSLNQQDMHEILNHAGKDHDLDVDLLASVIKAESGGNARAVSRTGARGLMQLMPGTAAGLGVEDSFRPDQNVRGGSAYLNSLLIRYHDNLALALAAYNAGPGAVDKYHGIPPYRETRAYVTRVIHEFNRRIRARASAERASATR
jgi:soluble lytic murein transglycosylase-like protein